MAQDEIRKDAAPTSRVTDMRAAAEQIIGVTRVDWSLPGIEDSTAASLGLEGPAAEKLLYGGFTREEYEKLRAKQAAGQVSR